MSSKGARSMIARTVATILLGAASASAQPADGPMDRRLAEIVRVLNAGDGEATRAFISDAFAPQFRDAFPMERHLEVWAELRRDTGGIEVVEVRPGSPTEAEATVRAREGGERLVLRIRLEPEPPYRIAGVGIGPPDPADRVEAAPLPEGPLTAAQAASDLAAHVDRLAAADAFSGVVLLARGDEILLQRAWGEADKSWGVENRLDTKFNLGSMNKMFTAVAIAQLAERGLLSWDDPVGKWLGEEWVRPEVGEKVTIHHLLTHTSGLGSYFTEEFMGSSRLRFREVADYAPLVREETLEFEPGSRWSYSNTGFLLLGAIVEAVTGEDYFDYVREHVYGPAGMNATDAYDMDAVVPNLAYGYDRTETDQGPRYRNTMFEHVVRGGPAGGGFSTAPDLLAFARALRDGKLVSPETLRRMTTDQTGGTGRDGGYGYGFILWDEEGRTWGHGGGFPGISSVLVVDPERDWTLVVLSNYSGAMFPVRDRAAALVAAVE